MSKLIFTLMMLYASSALAADAWKCGEKELRYGGKAKAGGTYCFRAEPYQLLSENCVDGKCVLLEKIRAAKDEAFDNPASTTGNPGFQICRNLGGEPRPVEFKRDGKWLPFNECRFAEDKSFANVDFLLYVAMGERPGR